MSAPLLAEAVFTGTSVYGLSPGTGLVRSHTDTWDSVTGRGAAAVVDLLKQVLSPQRTPPLEGPVYEVLLRRPGYEVRRYGASVEAVTRMPASAGPAGDGGGFGTLAGYIFGGNVTGEKMEMTTPVFTRVAADGKGSMAFPLERRLGPDPAGAPAPLDGARVARAVAPAGVRAAARFGGVATDGDVAREERVLRAALLADGLRPAAGYALARYNDPFTLPFFRRNEVLIDLEAPPPEFAA